MSIYDNLDILVIEFLKLKEELKHCQRIQSGQSGQSDQNSTKPEEWWQPSSVDIKEVKEKFGLSRIRHGTSYEEYEEDEED